MITSLIFAESASVAVLSKFLSCTHYAIPEIATTYKSGVAILKTQKPDMVYIDVSFVKKHHMELSHLKSRERFILLCDDLEDYNTYSWLFEDVLLKPFDFDKFKMCSFNLLTGWVASLLKMKDPSAGGYFTLRDGNKQRDFGIDLEDLLYMESCGNYVQVFDVYGGNETVRTTM
ncbi:hypothetical protein LPB86_05450 [Pedobacter sp. MC2016-14]|uniref:hypothetical protein n=1 Tax=Pedobacter sp. MC2016-14 TaxID=2897327 RepID=UPI001E585AD0|nr:hypothetical protein [Pedobacter sp. MC2016-14]MCD0487663.1 hypothetical protein [Pedobacter sp. MC2016-14]